MYRRDASLREVQVEALVRLPDYFGSDAETDYLKGSHENNQTCVSSVSDYCYGFYSGHGQW